ncbi:nucleotide exchange factor GrpE [Streptomyces reniochalinae]|uniref:Protein GrpE n=1 Tax=Streptomyces reniochalinae TaxID=2250578 RepID=A0A367F1F2_9ACTN|nr:nucleotide exchange factor GrpE [Streptomyces reniochalinae]RCG24101.1 nucleotide exchange factor GrpE [Streptomyces reniochalinae]
MTEETAGAGKKPTPDVPADAGEQAAAGAVSEQEAAPGPAAGDAQTLENAEGDVSAQDMSKAEDATEEQGAEGATEGGGSELEAARTALGERTQDLQRLQAEFQNYRRRVERDRAAVKEIAVANLLTELLPVLDDIGRARDHGELVGGFKSVAESLEMVAAKMGLMQFGKEGEPFDPTVHEALMHSYSPDVTETTCVQILQPGYRIGERTIRPARVGVAEPQPGAGGGKSEGGSDGSAAEEETGGPEEG